MNALLFPPISGDCIQCGRECQVSYCSDRCHRAGTSGFDLSKALEVSAKPLIVEEVK